MTQTNGRKGAITQDELDDTLEQVTASAVADIEDEDEHEDQDEDEAEDRHARRKPKAKPKSYMTKLNPEQQARQLAFKNYRITHPALRAVVADMLPLLMIGAETNVIAVTGATGVGKSTLTKVMLQGLVDEFDPLMEEDRSAVHLVYVEARRDGNSRNLFGRLYRKLIAQLHEPGMEKKVPFSIVDGRMVMHSRTGSTVDDLRDILETCLRQRKTRVVVIDEAAQLNRFGKPEDVMDTIKSLANTTGTKFVLVGSFDLFDILETSGQIARRTALLNMERYDAENAEDLKAFKKMVKSLQENWPCREKPNFVAIAKELCVVSLGCVGLLKAFMLDAANLQMRNAGEAWDPKFMLKAQKAMGLRSIIEDEIKRGETRVRDAVYGNSAWDEAKFDELVARMTSSERKKAYAI
ncbi:ATP-binding protein [Roseateles sp.]|uniref:ATP-binding protein n=1 Tax=Roseateles sp. TaxID=1971397 RepID=UPI0031DB7E67